MQKLSNGVANYEDLIKENRIYVDKTNYIEKMEQLPDKTLMFLRPRKFGKTLFTSSQKWKNKKMVWNPKKRNRNSSR